MKGNDSLVTPGDQGKFALLPRDSGKIKVYILILNEEVGKMILKGDRLTLITL